MIVGEGCEMEEVEFCAVILFLIMIDELVDCNDDELTSLRH